MNNLTFSEDSFNTIFPFYILFDDALVITSFGKSIAKLFPSLKKGKHLSEYFISKRPFLETMDIKNILENLNQLIILESILNKDLLMRGQFTQMNDNILFVGSPWFASLEEVRKNNLTIFDFANYDPQLDLLQILNTQQTTNKELKSLLKINNKQSLELKKDREELNRLSLVASANKSAIVFTDADAKIFWCNDAYLKVTGFTKEDIIGRTPIEVGKTPTTEKEALRRMADLFYKGEAFDVEITHARKDGSYFWTRTKGQPVYDSNGKLLQYFAIIEDMTEEKEKEEQLILLSLIAEKNINSVVICDNEGKIEWVNSSFITMSGYTAEELTGTKPGILLQGEESDPETVNYLSNQIKKGEPFKCEIINYSKTGRKYWVKIQGQALYNKFGEISKFFAIQEDVTDKKKLEDEREELVASLKKSNNDLEQYAQIVSHDLKSPLRSINTLISWIKEENGEMLTDQANNYFDLIEGKIEKMDHLIQGILTYSKIDNRDSNSEIINVDEIVTNIINIIDIPDHIAISICKKLPSISADRFRIQQLFQNIIGNAVNYIDKPQGLIEIDVEEHKKYNIFSIKDNGPGIAEENHEKIFRTFQSLTKNEKSTGLGLSIVKKIVDYYKGKIWIESKLGEGSVFYVLLFK
ncbi:PAS domain S-box protein [Flavobacterium sp. NRK1]|uniref:PAS domain S-box protein n=1 Tax=Flavobacterium sp. NRK1 TaxID=2954929 RepID=UPI002092904C|nr:PAS domain S-box protein [Flavobacterium sp. NRK1]MCO6149183.1 PAS domain S-box protein [Flavobacterium sp. NRK1]